jgi:hypothetical protein
MLTTGGKPFIVTPRWAATQGRKQKAKGFSSEGRQISPLNGRSQIPFMALNAYAQAQNVLDDARVQAYLDWKKSLAVRHIKEMQDKQPILKPKITLQSCKVEDFFG